MQPWPCRQLVPVARRVCQAGRTTGTDRSGSFRDLYSWQDSEGRPAPVTCAVFPSVRRRPPPLRPDAPKAAPSAPSGRCRGSSPAPPSAQDSRSLCPVVASTWSGTSSWRSPTLSVPVGSNMRIAAPDGAYGLCSAPRGTVKTAPWGSRTVRSPRAFSGFGVPTPQTGLRGSLPRARRGFRTPGRRSGGRRPRAACRSLPGRRGAVAAVPGPPAGRFRRAGPWR